MRFAFKRDLGEGGRRGRLSVEMVVGWNLPGRWFSVDRYGVVGLKVVKMRMMKCVSVRVERLSGSRVALERGDTR